MTYQEQIEWLLKDSHQKSQAYIATIKEKRRNPNPADVANRDKTYKEWEAAEYAYTSFLISTKMQRVNLSDRFQQ